METLIPIEVRCLMAGSTISLTNSHGLWPCRLSIWACRKCSSSSWTVWGIIVVLSGGVGCFGDGGGCGGVVAAGFFSLEGEAVCGIIAVVGRFVVVIDFVVEGGDLVGGG